MPESTIPDTVWQLIGTHLGYDDEELAQFRADPRNEKVLRAGAVMREKTIVFEVIKSNGCNSQHEVGTRFYFTGDGNLIASMAPPRTCAFVLPVMAQAMYGLHELLYAGIDPNEACFKRASCFDVGLACGGWGNIVVEASVVDRSEAKRMYAESNGTAL